MKGFLFFFLPPFQSIVFLHCKVLNTQAWIGGDRLMSGLGAPRLSIIIISLSPLASVTAFISLNPCFCFFSCHVSPHNVTFSSLTHFHIPHIYSEFIFVIFENAFDKSEQVKFFVRPLTALTVSKGQQPTKS